MDLVKKYSNTVIAARDLALKSITNEVYQSSLKERSEKLLQSLKDDAYIKIPFVGDFNAGKSSLINAFIGRKLLPTNIRPETAVAYELYYSENERLEHYRDGQLLSNYPLEQIKEIATEAGDIVKVFINNDKIKSLNDRQIVIVDMPGIGSGIESHNKAITNYIINGKAFVIITSIEQGTLRSSTLTFIDELKQSGIKFALLLSKVENKPAEEVKDIHSYIQQQAKTVMGEDVYVGLTSAHEGELADLNTALDSFKADKIVEMIYKKDLRLFIQGIIQSIVAQTDFVIGDKSKLQAKIQELKTSHEEAIKELESQKAQLTDTDSATESVLKELENTLKSKASILANTLIQNSDNHDIFVNEVIGIIRPALLNSIKIDAKNFQDKIAFISEDFSKSISQDKESGIDSLLENIGFIPDLITSSLESLITTFVGKYLKNEKIAKVLNIFIRSALSKIIEKVLSIGKSIYEWFMGDSYEIKMEKLVQGIIETIIPNILNELKTPINEIIIQQRSCILEELTKQINATSEEYQAMMLAAEKEDTMKKDQETQYLAQVKEHLTQLQAMI